MEYTKGELAKWLRAELVDLVKDIETVHKSDMPEFNQGLDIICAYDTKVEKILEKLAAPDLYEALSQVREWVKKNRGGYYPTECSMVEIALAKADIRW